MTCIVTWLMLSILASVAGAQASTTRPAPAPAVAGQYETQSIRRSGPTSGPTSRDSAGASASTSSRSHNLLDIQRVMLALLLVIGLIFALRWCGKRLFPSVVAGRAAGVVRVLSRSPVSPKQQVVLVQVGRRVLVVADNGAQMSPLSEITDPDEVASLVGQLNSGANPAAREAFGMAFGAAQRDFDEKIEAAPSAEEESNDDEAVTSTRGEIDGLMEKARVLARQLGRS